MNSQGQVNMFQCWKCRKYVANSNCLIKDQNADLFEQPHSSTASQDVCNVWHMNIEALPDWVTCIIEKAQWTTGKLNCPFCGACLGGFNFVNNTKCSCGQFTNIHLCKRQTDCQAASSVTSPILQLNHLSLCKVHSDFNKEIWPSVTGGTSEARNQRLSYMAKNNDGIGRLMEALCLEVRSTNFEMNSKKIHFTVSNPKTSISASLAVNDRYSVKAFHRKSQSLDLNFRGRLVLLPTLYGTSMIKRPVFSRQQETQPFNTKGCLRLKSSRTHNYFQFPLKSDAGELPKTFSVTSYSVLAQEETKFKPCLEASKTYFENAATDQQLFLSSSQSTAEAVQQHCTSLGHLQHLTIIDQKVSKKKRNLLNSLKRKQRWQGRWLQKQTMNTEEEREHRQDKESYLCAVCLDVYFNPYMCYPCHHIFCEPCLRTLAKDNPTSTPCPLCRTAIAQVFFQSELNNSTKTHFPVEYSKLKEHFQESSLAKCPLPSCKKAFRVIEDHINIPGMSEYSWFPGSFLEPDWHYICHLQDFTQKLITERGFQSPDSFTRRHFPHAAHRMDYMDFEDDSRVWRFDMDLVIIYIYSINWVIGFIVFCFLCYFFFPF